MGTVSAPPLPSHEERRRIIEAPIPLVLHHPHTYSWSGVHIRESIPEAGHRVFRLSAEDEEWCRNKYEQD